MDSSEVRLELEECMYLSIRRIDLRGCVDGVWDRCILLDLESARWLQGQGLS